MFVVMQLLHAGKRKLQLKPSDFLDCPSASAFLHHISLPPSETEDSATDCKASVSSLYQRVGSGGMEE